MAVRSDRGVRRVVAVIVGLIAIGVLLTGSLAAPRSTAVDSVRVLQMNLCDSGIAECYTGRSVAEAAGVIRSVAPDVVTLNEVCRPDVKMLERALAGVFPGSNVVSAFRAATDRRTGGAFQCTDGQPYGIGVVMRIAAPVRGYATYSGIYPHQDPVDPEERAWLCVHATGGIDACTTHLDNISPAVALSQCEYLWHTIVPAVRAEGGGSAGTVVGGDLNLRFGGPVDVRACLPPVDARSGDGGVQYVVATAGFTVASGTSIGMLGTTDHPGLLVSLAAASIR